MTLVLIACFLTVALAITGAGYWFLNRPEGPVLEPGAPEIRVMLGSAEGPLDEAPGLEFLRTLGLMIPGAGRANAALDQDLVSAGYRDPARRAYFHGVQAATGLLVAIAAVFVWKWLGYGAGETLLVAMAGGMAGGWLVRTLLRGSVDRRRDRIRAALPSALDLLVLGMEAGQPLDLALTDTSRELRRAHPDLSFEFAMVPIELRAGNPRAEVLSGLARRIGEKELTRLVHVMIDSDRYGTSMAPALKNHARYLRTRRRQSAQEQARKVSVKLVFPVFFLIFPSVLLVTLGPAIINLYTNLIPMMMK